MEKMKSLFFLSVMITFGIFLLIGLMFYFASTVSASEDAEFEGLSKDIDYLMVVNPEHPYEFGSDYDKAIQDNLVTTNNPVDGGEIKVEAATLYAFTQLQKELVADGVVIGIYEGYRSAEQEEYLKENFNSDLMEAGYSEYHTGLVLSVVVYTDDGWVFVDDEKTDGDEPSAYDILKEKMADYGFIIRYPEGKAQYTGIVPEPFSIRFVGSSKIAHEIMDKGLSLEEYLGMAAIGGEASPNGSPLDLE